MASAIIRNAITAFRKSPINSLLPLTSRAIAEKSGFPAIAAMSGVRRSLTSAVTTAPNAAPMTTATARSTTLPRRMNSLKPLNILRFPSTRVSGRAYGDGYPGFCRDCGDPLGGILRHRDENRVEVLVGVDGQH